jgi:glycerophosphoryl diester phosphodiesterase
VSGAHAAGLAVHPYTFRKDDLPAGIGDFHALLELFLGQLHVDGVFTDFPDLAADYIARRFTL